MIVKFDLKDLEKFAPNQFSRVDEIMPALENELLQKYTLWDDGIVKAIICFVEVQPSEYGIFLLTSKSFSFMEARAIKRFMARMIEQYSATRVFTLSEDCKVINMWHNFLGFVLVKPKHSVIEGLEYNLWEILCGIRNNSVNRATVY